MLQFDARVVDAELPVDPGLFAIALLGADCRAASGGSRDLRSSCRRGFRSEVFHRRMSDVGAGGVSGEARLAIAI